MDFYFQAGPPQTEEAGDSVVPSSSIFGEGLSTNEDVSQLLTAEISERVRLVNKVKI